MEEMSERVRQLIAYIIRNYDMLLVEPDMERIIELKLKMAQDVAKELYDITGKKVYILNDDNFDAWFDEINSK